MGCTLLRRIGFGFASVALATACRPSGGESPISRALDDDAAGLRSLVSGCQATVSRESEGLVYSDGDWGVIGYFEEGDSVTARGPIQYIDSYDAQFALVSAPSVFFDLWVRLDRTDLLTRCGSGGGDSDEPSDDNPGDSGDDQGDQGGSGDQSARLVDRTYVSPDDNCEVRVLGQVRPGFQEAVDKICPALTMADREIVRPAIGISAFEDPLTIDVRFADGFSNGLTPLPHDDTFQLVVGSDCASPDCVLSMAMHEFGHVVMHTMSWRMQWPSASRLYQTPADEFFADAFAVYAFKDLSAMTRGGLVGHLRDFAVRSSCADSAEEFHGYFAPAKSAVKQRFVDGYNPKFPLRLLKALPQLVNANDSVYSFGPDRCEIMNQKMTSIIQQVN